MLRWSHENKREEKITLSTTRKSRLVENVVLAIFKAKLLILMPPPAESFNQIRESRLLEY